MLPYTIDEIKRRITPVAQKYSLAAVYLFGSYARGDATAESDVDLLVDLSGSTAHGMLLGVLCADLEEALDRHRPCDCRQPSHPHHAQQPASFP